LEETVGRGRNRSIKAYVVTHDDDDDYGDDYLFAVQHWDLF